MASAAILAGGRARRFGGCDKGALTVGGRSIFDRQLTELSRVADDIMVVGMRAGRSSWRSLGGTNRMVRSVADRVSACGPLGGLDAALTAAHDDALVLVACDMPFVTAELLGFLLALTREADAVVPRTERGYHPVCAAYTRACRPAVARRLAQGRLAMAGLLEDVRVRVVGPDELDAFGSSERLLANVNTPAEYHRLEAFQHHEP